MTSLTSIRSQKSNRLRDLSLQLQAKGESLESVLSRVHRLLATFEADVRRESDPILKGEYEVICVELRKALNTDGRPRYSRSLPFLNQQAKLNVRTHNKNIQKVYDLYKIASQDIKDHIMQRLHLRTQLVEASIPYADQERYLDILDDLSQISTSLTSTDVPARDEAETELQTVLGDSMLKSLIENFPGETAVYMLDVLEKIYLAVNSDSDSLRKQLLRVSSRLAKSSQQMPTSAILSAVIIAPQMPSAHGGFANVYRGTYKGASVAVKRFIKPREELDGAFCHEAVLWRGLQHPFVLPFLGIHISEGLTCLVSPWRDKGSIRDHLASEKPLDIDKALLQVACGLKYIHGQNVIHGDIKGPNILLDDNLNAQICDFGLGLWNETSVGSSTSQRQGTTRYMAPELLFDPTRPCAATDVFAFGCLAFEMHSGVPPFPKLRSEFRVRDELQAGHRSERPRGKEARVKEFDDRMWALVEKCWSQDADSRPSIDHVASEMTGWA